MPDNVIQAAGDDLHSEVAALKAELESLVKVDAKVENQLLSLEDLTLAGGGGGVFVLALMLVWFHYRAKCHATKEARYHGYDEGRRRRLENGSTVQPSNAVPSHAQAAFRLAQEKARANAEAASRGTGIEVKESKRPPLWSPQTKKTPKKDEQ